MWLQRIRSQCRQNHKEASAECYTLQPSTMMKCGHARMTSRVIMCLHERPRPSWLLLFVHMNGITWRYISLSLERCLKNRDLSNTSWGGRRMNKREGGKPMKWGNLFFFLVVDLQGSQKQLDLSTIWSWYLLDYWSKNVFLTVYWQLLWGYHRRNTG